MKLFLGDCFDRLKKFEENSVDSVVTDPPYGLSFMGKKWDYDVPSVEIWKEVLRVLKPGGHLLSFCGTRTYHRMVVRIEDAGFEVRDQIFWCYGQGFPKSKDLGKDKTGALCQCASERRSTLSTGPLQGEAFRTGKDHASGGDALRPEGAPHSTNTPSDSPADCQSSYDSCDARVHGEIEDAQASSQPQECALAHSRSDARDGGEASESLRSPSSARRIDLPSNPDSFRPENESIDGLGRKRANSKRADTSESSSSKSGINRGLSSGSYSNPMPQCKECGKPNAYGWGSALKPAVEPICLARKPISEKNIAENVLKWGVGGINVDASRIGTDAMTSGGSIPDIRANNYENAHGKARLETPLVTKQGRFPANLLLDEEAAAALDAQSGERKSGAMKVESRSMGFHGGAKGASWDCESSTGGASRFFYVAKVSAAERNAGLEGMPKKDPPGSKRSEPAPGRSTALGAPRANHHPTVKPIKLMEYLCRLITPPGGTVLDPFMGSGSTGVAAKNLGMGFIGIEKEYEYHLIASARIK